MSCPAAQVSRTSAGRSGGLAEASGARARAAAVREALTRRFDMNDSLRSRKTARAAPKASAVPPLHEGLPDVPWLRRKAQMPGHCGRHVEEYPLLAELVSAQAPLQKPPEDVQPLTFAAANEQHLQLTNQEVLEIGQHAPRPQQPLVRPKDVAHQRQGEVIQRQTGYHVVVNTLTRHFLQRGVEQPTLTMTAAPERLLLEATTQQSDKVRVDLDNVEPVARPQDAQDLVGDGARAGADLQDASGDAAPAHLRHQGARQAAAARQDRAGVAILAAKLLVEFAAFLQVAHPGSLGGSSGTRRSPRCDGSIPFFPKRATGTFGDPGKSPKFHAGLIS